MFINWRNLLSLVLFAIQLSATQKCELPDFYKKRIQRDLMPFKEGITSEMLEKGKVMSHICTFTIKNGRGLLQSGGSNCYSAVFHNSLDIHLPDMQVLINPQDEPTVLKHSCNRTEVHWTDDCYCDSGFIKPAHGFFTYPNHWRYTTQLVPIFSPSTIKQCFHDILIPSNYQFNQQRQVVALKMDWNKRKSTIFWRGSPTGGYDSMVDTKYQRHKLVDLCKTIPDCDASFGNYLFDGIFGPPSKIQEMYGQAEPVRLSWMAKFKIIIDIDGNTYSSRFTTLMRMGVAIIKIAAFDDFGFVAARPWQHYIPVDISLIDFEQKIQWAKNNDEEVEKIARRAKQFGDKIFTIQIYQCYTRTLLLEYYQLLIKGGGVTL